MDNKYSDNDLRNLYTAYGHFYNLDYGRYPTLPCRSILDLIDNRCLYTYIKKGGNITPSAVAIMMNPGCSRPLCDKQSPTYKKKSIPTKDWQLVETIPDDTQYQLMRLMIRYELKYIRVINLTDVRNTDSKSLKPFLKEYSDNHHSIFSIFRELELHNILNSNPNAPIIAAWGVYDWLMDLIDPCWDSINDRIIVGYKKDSSEKLYYHPLPRKKYYKSELLPLEQWVYGIIKSADPIFLPEVGRE
ncbi:MAG: hypothetical protein M0Q99_10935 [Candidatus Cloacimonetes bacterium]|nr:hypothetical protein [Candidatus Cloacimonadota bacterium]